MPLDPNPGRFQAAARTRLCLHMRRGVLLLALALLPAVAVGQGMTTETDGDVLDGEIADLAIQSDATSFPQLKRGWIAQGWARAAIRVSDGARMNAETRTFSWVMQVPERIVAVELDDARSYLYTLTDQALYREDVTNPAIPSQPTFFNFTIGAANLVPQLGAGETLLSVRVIPFVGTSLGDSRILVLTSQRLIVMRSDATGLSVVGQCLDVYKALLAGGYLTSSSDAFFNSHKIKSLASVKVAIDASGLTIAYVQANPGIFAARTAQRAILMLCNLDAAGAFQSPTFDAAWWTPTATEYAYWSPFTTFPAANDTEAIEAVAIHDLTVRLSGTQTEVLVACGMTRQLHRLKATFQPNGVLSVSPTPTVVLNPLENLRQVTWDPILPDRLYVRGSHNFFVVDLSGTPTTLASIPERAHKVDRGDATIVRTLDVGGERRTHWALSHGPEDYNLQAIDVTSTVPVQSFGDGYIERCDGGVALDADNVYVGTGAGVRHYRRVAGVWEQAGYRPASSTALSASGGRFSEQLDLVGIGGAHQILGASNAGVDVGLFAWPISATTMDPEDGTYFPIPPSVFSTPNNNPIYVNDVVTFTAGAMTYAALCPTRFGVPHGTGSWEVALVLFRWDPAAVKWVLVASANRSGPQYTFANTVTIADLATPAQRVAFVATDTGVMSFSLNQLTSATPQVQFVSEDYAGEVHGIAATPQHLIAAYTHVPDGQRKYAIYSWNQLTGEILANPILLGVSQIGAPIKKTWKLRYDPLTSSTGDLYDANDPGVFRLRYTADPLSITHLGTWNHQGGAGIVQDCRPYSFGGVDKLLVIKDDQAFAWVMP